MLIRTVFLVPGLDNESRPFEETEWLDLEARLKQFGGFTRGAAVEGVWSDANQTYEDRNRQYIVALESWRQFPAWLLVVEWALIHFRQEAI